jgi:hypothetical protein
MDAGSTINVKTSIFRNGMQSNFIHDKTPNFYLASCRKMTCFKGIVCISQQYSLTHPVNANEVAQLRWYENALQD